MKKTKWLNVLLKWMSKKLGSCLTTQHQKYRICLYNKTVIPFALVVYELIAASSCLYFANTTYTARNFYCIIFESVHWKIHFNKIKAGCRTPSPFSLLKVPNNPWVYRLSVSAPDFRRLRLPVGNVMILQTKTTIKSYLFFSLTILRIGIILLVILCTHSSSYSEHKLDVEHHYIELIYNVMILYKNIKDFIPEVEGMADN